MPSPTSIAKPPPQFGLSLLLEDIKPTTSDITIANMSDSKKTGRTLALVKPDALTPYKYQQIDALIKLNEFTVARQKLVWLTSDQATQLFPTRSFDANGEEWLDYITCAPCMALELEREDAPLHWQITMGPEDPSMAGEDEGDCIRSGLAVDSIRNAVDGSQEPEEAESQLKFVFSDEIPEIPYDDFLMKHGEDARNTLAIIKPDVSQDKEKVAAIIRRIMARGYEIKDRVDLQLSSAQCHDFYAEHKGKPFYDGLVSFMSSGPVIALLLDGDDVIRGWRTMIGPADPEVARVQAPLSIRAVYGSKNPNSTIHGSDSAESAQREINFFFFPRIQQADEPEAKEEQQQEKQPESADNVNKAEAKKSEGKGKSKSKNKKRRNKSKQPASANQESFTTACVADEGEKEHVHFDAQASQPPQDTQNGPIPGSKPVFEEDPHVAEQGIPEQTAKDAKDKPTESEVEPVSNEELKGLVVDPVADNEPKEIVAKPVVSEPVASEGPKELAIDPVIVEKTKEVVAEPVVNDEPKESIAESKETAIDVVVKEEPKEIVVNPIISEEPKESLVEPVAADDEPKAPETEMPVVEPVSEEPKISAFEPASKQPNEKAAEPVTDAKSTKESVVYSPPMETRSPPSDKQSPTSIGSRLASSPFLKADRQQVNESATAAAKKIGKIKSPFLNSEKSEVDASSFTASAKQTTQAAPAVDTPATTEAAKEQTPSDVKQDKRKKDLEAEAIVKDKKEETVLVDTKEEPAATPVEYGPKPETKVSEKNPKEEDNTPKAVKSATKPVITPSTRSTVQPKPAAKGPSRTTTTSTSKPTASSTTATANRLSRRTSTTPSSRTTGSQPAADRKPGNVPVRSTTTRSGVTPTSRARVAPNGSPAKVVPTKSTSSGAVGTGSSAVRKSAVPKAPIRQPAGTASSRARAAAAASKATTSSTGPTSSARPLPATTTPVAARRPVATTTPEKRPSAARRTPVASTTAPTKPLARSASATVKRAPAATTTSAGPTIRTTAASRARAAAAAAARAAASTTAPTTASNGSKK